MIQKVTSSKPSLKNLWNMKVMVIPVVVGALRMIL